MVQQKPKPTLDESYYFLDDDELKFFMSETGLKCEEALKAHIFAVQAKAHDIYPYPCIRHFAFTKLKISRLPAYKHVLQLGKERENAILLDIGCCFGNDARKAVSDGFPIQNVIASDLRPEFLDLGLDLFKSSREAFPIAFVPGDTFDSAFLAPSSPVYEATNSPPPPLSLLTTLTPLHGQISAIHASSFFHLFDEEKQLELANRLASLLSPLPGSVIFGSHGGLPVKGLKPLPTLSWPDMFCHSPESWKELWDGGVFTKGSVRVDAYLKEAGNKDLPYLPPGTNFHIMVWSVTRL